jgi:hypothetical protein
MASRSDPWTIARPSRAHRGYFQHFLNYQTRVSKSQTGQDVLFSITPTRSAFPGGLWSENISRDERFNTPQSTISCESFIGRRLATVHEKAFFRRGNAVICV